MNFQDINSKDSGMFHDSLRKSPCTITNTEAREMVAQLPHPMSLGGQNNRRAYTNYTHPGGNHQTESIGIPGSEDSNIYANLDVGFGINTTSSSEWANIQQTKHRRDIGVQKYDLDLKPTIKGSEEQVGQPKDDKSSLIFEELEQKGLKDALVKITKALDQLSHDISRIEHTQNVILKRINRRRSCSQFLID
ncbi:hypothetical protein X943_002725 [Babesia divergens]|uniref:Uncharacterized protein n=1 Tax=Babesia divergens TaxID=32595 RepID=A0AAD9G7E3_BABDI|nr:hypothetical protein X943_002725 [Babesia divergens]